LEYLTAAGWKDDLVADYREMVYDFELAQRTVHSGLDVPVPGMWKESGCEEVNWIELANGRVPWQQTTGNMLVK
jgi:hypothetical protein